MFAYSYAGEPVTVVESANTLMIEFEDGTLCPLKKDQAGKLFPQTFAKSEPQGSPESKRSPSLSVRPESLAKVVNLSERRKNQNLN